jgi:riboflavin synthase
MFTGLVQAIGAVREAHPRQDGKGMRLVVDTGAWTHRPAAGESICVSGCCLTVAGSAQGPLVAFDVVPETLRRTTLGGLREGSRVNLERSLRPEDLMGGHCVQGHVEGLGQVVSVTTGSECRLIVRPPPDLMPCIVPKGSIAIDGVSLTVAGADPAGCQFQVALIPTTLGLTTLGGLREGHAVNLETDILARTVVNTLRNYPGLLGDPGGSR